MKKKQFAALALVGALMAGNISTAFAATFGSIKDSAAKGTWSDTNNLTWTWWDNGESVVIGSGPKFNDVYPEIADPEYFLKESICYPGETVGTLNSQGQPKADYTEGTLPLLQEFVNSFDWINSDEVTRLKKVHDRIANGRNGNTDQHTEGGTWGDVSFTVLQNKKGVCRNYAGEFTKLCSYVGLECVTYTRAENHVACIVKINDQWIAVDPFIKTTLFDNGYTVPVDFDTEYHRWENEYRNSEEYKAGMDIAEAAHKARAGEITWTEYYQLLNPGMSVEEIKQFYRNNGIELDI